MSAVFSWECWLPALTCVWGSPSTAPSLVKPAWERGEGFPPPPDKDLESPSSTRLEALVPSLDSRARTRSPSPRAWMLP